MVNKFMRKKKFRSLWDEGNENLSSGKYEDGIKSYTKAIRIYAKEPIVFNNRSYANLLLGNIEAAYQDINKALELDPKCILAICTLGNIQQNEGKYKEAIINYEKAISIEPADTNAYFYLYKLYSKLEDKDRAYNYLKQAAKLGDKAAIKILDKLKSDWVYHQDKDINIMSDFYDNYAQKTFDDLLGGHEEYLKVIRWQSENVDLVESQDFKKSLRSSNFNKMLYSLGKLAFKYDQLNGNDRRKLGDIEVQNMIEYKRNIRTIGEEDSIEFSYTMGNYFQDIPVPELLSFYPSEGTIRFLFNTLSDQLIDETIKPLNDAETREVYGLLGYYGQIPIRLRLLNDHEKKESQKKWACGVPLDSEIILVDVPDTHGYFASEIESSTHIKEKFPKSLWINTSTTSITNLVNEKPSPCSLDAFYTCLYQNTNYIRYVDPSRKDLSKEFRWATIVILLVIAEEIEIYSIKEDNEIDQDWFGRIKDIYIKVSFVKSLKKWVHAKLESCDQQWLERTWCIGKNNFVDFCRYENVDSFLEDVEWQAIESVINCSWNDSISKEKTEKLRKSKLAWDKENLPTDIGNKSNLDISSNEQDEDILESLKKLRENYEGSGGDKLFLHSLIKRATQLIDLNEHLGEAYFYRGYAHRYYLPWGDGCKDAISDFNLAEENSLNNSDEIFYYRSLTYLELWQPGKALNDFQSLLEILKKEDGKLKSENITPRQILVIFEDIGFRIASKLMKSGKVLNLKGSEANDYFSKLLLDVDKIVLANNRFLDIDKLQNYQCLVKAIIGTRLSTNLGLSNNEEGIWNEEKLYLIIDQISTRIDNSQFKDWRLYALRGRLREVLKDNDYLSDVEIAFQENPKDIEPGVWIDDEWLFDLIPVLMRAKDGPQRELMSENLTNFLEKEGEHLENWEYWSEDYEIPYGTPQVQTSSEPYIDTIKTFKFEYEIPDDWWDLVTSLRNEEGLIKEKWQEKYAIFTKQDWEPLEKEIEKEFLKIWSSKPPKVYIN